MNKLAIVNKVTRAVHKVGFKFKKHSPEILIVTGVVGVVTSTVMACKATTKLDDILEETNDKVEKIHECAEHPENLPAEYTEEDSKKDLVIVYTQAGLKVAKLYAPAVVVGVASLGAILWSHKILRGRNVALAAAYATVEKSFKEYRGRVIERFGEELDKELKYNIKAKTIDEIVVNEDGTESVVSNTVKVYDPNTIDDTSRIFYEGNPGWDKNPLYTMEFLKKQQRYANDKLKCQGYLFLNDVYEMLGYDKVPYGFVIGWLYDEKNPVGDNFVDFGLYNIGNPNTIRFVNGDEKAILLEFNHDGNIIDKM